MDDVFGTGPTWVNGKHKKDRGGYCWLYRYLIDPTHNSENCDPSQLKEGHTTEATHNNNMEGNQYGKTHT